MLEKTKLSEPNELGYQFGINKSLTDWAHQEQNNFGNIMPSVDITVLEVWKDNKLETYLLIDEKKNKEIDEAQGYEAAAVAIDKWKLVKKTEKYED